MRNPFLPCPAATFFFRTKCFLALVLSASTVFGASKTGAGTVVPSSAKSVANLPPAVTSVNFQAVSPSTPVTVIVPAGKSLIVPISGADPDGNQIGYTVSSADPAKVTALVKTGNPFLRLIVSYTDENGAFRTGEEMVFQLFQDWTPRTAATIAGLAQSGFYDGLTFHRVIADFMIQGGDPAGTGNGGPGFTFDDEFKAPLVFSGFGQLAMANSGKDTNGSQFFVTVNPARHLDFNHTIFGQLVRGEEVLRRMNRTPTGTGDKPNSPATIEKAEIIESESNAALVISVVGTDQPVLLTIKAIDARGSESAPVTVNVQPTRDNTDSPPFLSKVADVFAPSGVAGYIQQSKGSLLPAEVLRIPLPKVTQDLEFNPTELAADLLPPSPNPIHGFVGSELRMGIPAVNGKPFRGSFLMKIGVRQQGATTRGRDPYLFDTQTFTIAVGDRRPAGRPVILRATPGVALAGGGNAPATVATYLDLPTARAEDFTATVNWGDATVDANLTPVRTGAGRFAVKANHTYDQPGVFPVDVTLRGKSSANGVPGAAVFIHSTAVVADSSLWVTVQPISIPRRREFRGSVATFTHAGSTAGGAEYSAVIDWGDGVVSEGQIAKSPDGFHVLGRHTYAQPETYTVRITVRGPGELSATAFEKANVTGLPVGRFLPPFRYRDVQPKWSGDAATLKFKDHGVSLSGVLSGALTLSNTGLTSSGAGTVKIYVSKSALFDPAQATLVGSRNFATLAPRASTTLRFAGLDVSTPDINPIFHPIYVITVVDSPPLSPNATNLHHVHVHNPKQVQ